MKNIFQLGRSTWKQARRLVIFVIGGTTVLFGIILIFTPGPALVVIPIGLAILAKEFAWARKILKRIKDEGHNFASKVTKNNSSK